MKAAPKAVFGIWADLKVSQLNRLLRPFNVRLVVKGSKAWGDQVNVVAQAILEQPAAPARAPSATDP